LPILCEITSELHKTIDDRRFPNFDKVRKKYLVDFYLTMLVKSNSEHLKNGSVYAANGRM